jgi:hypothetical protein
MPITCHKCHKTGISDAATVCPQCGTALLGSPSNVKMIEAFRDISVLKGQNVEYKSRMEAMSQTMFGLRAKIFAYWLLFLTTIAFALLYFYHRTNKYENKISELTNTANILHKNNEKQRRIINTYTKMYNYRPTTVYYGKAVAPIKPLVNEVLYVVEAGDDLEIVSTFFFGNTLFAHQIGSDNGLNDHDKIMPEQKLRIRAHY